MSILVPAWEFQVLDVVEAPNLQGKLNNEGKKGWELVSATSKDHSTGRYIFKRPSGFQEIDR